MKRKKKILIISLLGILLLTGFWFYVLPMYFKKQNVSNPPTAEELQRMREIEESSSKIAPDAVPGAGVRPVGSLPKTPPPSEESTSTASSSSEALPLQ
jgi:hypothetical protein